MKVLFSNPPWWVKRFSFAGEEAPASAWLSGVRAGSRWPHTNPAHSSPGNFVFGEYLPYPFFMGYAASYTARATGAKVVFRDSIALRESYAAYFAHLAEERYDYIVLETATPCWEQDQEIVRQIKARAPETRIVLTGALSVKGETLLEEHPVHAVIQGEYEKGVLRVLNGASGVIPYDLLTVEEMNAAPYPYWDEVIAHRYWDPNPVGQKAPQLQVWASRGCPYKCIFCVWPATMTGNDPDGTGKRTVRFYSPDYIEGMLRDLVGRYGYKSIYFDDDTFNLSDRHVLGICEVMGRLNLPWSAMCRADTVSMDTWRAMRESGCFGVKLGFESGNQWVNDNIVNKRLDLERAHTVVHELKRLGMTVHGTFTYGLPGETPAQMMDTKRYIARLPLDTYQETGCGEIDGTPLATLREKGQLDRYQGAALDDRYLFVPDGGEKMRRLAESSELAIGMDQPKDTSEVLQRQWSRLGRAIAGAAAAGPVGAWGIGTDFQEALRRTPELSALVAAGRVRLYDGARAGETLGGMTIHSPSALPASHEAVFLTARMLASRNSMQQEARRLGVAAERLRDVYDEDACDEDGGPSPLPQD
ncbi:B12-binding domain-containing radical SAM protein [Azospirillum rugosum]|uniref:Radical SAM superfamily enzyme YgiQ (UPF0313 family) n=1 Tax=Azospirillum rugosum TaxID=416170 RepID=A0ABS4SQS5_9PROT|nr:radical SAM protein [Azospirillum rugosum]MBP2294307.1 radical SAM superfamily enzyme YgiQ (UPF0313 family) [Azospirillum rugosum]MDQ0527642.1 radical SAM superfamily enzyme YgiQ (UPF0313 family) [Azospirillum rugosum]